MKEKDNRVSNMREKTSEDSMKLKRSNVNAALNKLCREEKLIKIKGKPVNCEDYANNPQLLLSYLFGIKKKNCFRAVFVSWWAIRIYMETTFKNAFIDYVQKERMKVNSKPTEIVVKS